MSTGGILDKMINLYQHVLLVKQGDEEAFEALVDQFKPTLIRNASRSGHYDEDCYQECLLKLYEGLLKYRPIDYKES